MCVWVGVSPLSVSYPNVTVLLQVTQETCRLPVHLNLEACALPQLNTRHDARVETLPVTSNHPGSRAIDKQIECKILDSTWQAPCPKGAKHSCAQKLQVLVRVSM